MKRILSLLICSLLLLGCAVTAAAKEPEAKSFTILNYNVAGLPDFKALIGQSDGIKVSEKEEKLGKVLNETGIDIIAVQEDFNYNRNLCKGLSDVKYKTIHSGGVPFGDGLNVYSRFPVYNTERHEWRTRYGIFDEGDELTPKGILYTAIEIDDGVYIDIYDIHADAFDTEGSREARVDEYMQLEELINSFNHNRPIIITGDFNISLHHAQWDKSGAEQKKIFVDRLGMKDAWIECCNDGNYEDFSEAEKSGLHYWGNWDSVEKFYYRDGGGIHLEAENFEYICYRDEDGNAFSDHNAAKAVFNYSLTDDYTKPDPSEFKVEHSNFIVRIFKNTATFFKTLYICLSNISKLKDVL